MLEIAQKDIFKSLKLDNPWWNSSDAFTESNFEHERAYLKPFIELSLNWRIKRSAILMGPRRVGKTVMLKQLIRNSIKEGFSQKRILFVSIDTPIYSDIPLAKYLEYFEELTQHSSEVQRIVIFDEIQYLKDWELHLKVLTDQYPNTRFIASGSAAAALKLKSQESGAGRFTDFFLPPLTFAEFLIFRGKEKELIQPYEHGTTYRYKTDNIDELNREFVKYLNFGGYPEAVLSEDIQNDVQRYLGRDIIDKVLLRDLPSLYGIQDIQELNRLFTKIAYHTSQEVSLDELSKSSGVAKNTITRYLEYLEAAFLIVRVSRVDETGKTFKRARSFKVYLTNPSMRSALFSPIDEADEAMGAMAETAAFSQWFHSHLMKDIYYARWKSGRKELEVDLVKVDSATLKPTWAYEVKWSDRFAMDQPNKLLGLVTFAKNNQKYKVKVGATSKTISAETNVDGIRIKHFPTALHCYQVGKNITGGVSP
ncbi:MAG: ATP-binding protein [Alphaproteobacteria bacterium]